MNDTLIFFGGTFDPPHIGHKEMLLAARNAYPNAHITVMPTFLPPHKQTFYAASAADRLNMCKIAFGDVKNVAISDYEIKKQGKSYSFETLAYLKNEYPDKEILFLMGTDMMKSFGSWKNPQEILRLSTPLLCYRKGDGEAADITAKNFEKEFSVKPFVLPFDGVEASSTDIKIRYMLSLPVTTADDKILGYIKENGLYNGDEKFKFIRENLKPARIEHTAGVVEYALDHAAYYKLD